MAESSRKIYKISLVSFELIWMKGITLKLTSVNQSHNVLNTGYADQDCSNCKRITATRITLITSTICNRRLRSVLSGEFKRLATVERLHKYIKARLQIIYKIILSQKPNPAPRSAIISSLITRFTY